jgi:seryl-tRNA synthetase
MLNDDLEKLRQEVNILVNENEEARDKLNAIINDIEKKIETPGDEAHHSNLTTRVKEAISHFETDHPRATAILNDIMVSLSNMGI